MPIKPKLLCRLLLCLSLVVLLPTTSDAGSIDHLINAAGRESGVDPHLLKEVISIESGFRPDRISPKGAIGYMQLMPETAKDLGVNPHDPWENIWGGAQYLKSLLARYGNDLKLALAAYNAGPGRVTDKVPNFPETQKYVSTIISRYDRVTSLNSTALYTGRPKKAAQFYKDLARADIP